MCIEESGCITTELDCQHEHKVNGGEADREDGLGRDEDCGYSPVEPGTPCTYVCEICSQDGEFSESTKPEEKVSTPSDALEMTPEQIKAMKNVLAVENPVASVTIDGVKTEYASLGEAINAADGHTATITLLQSTSEDLSTVAVMSGNIALHLNGQSITNSSAGLSVLGGTVTITGEGTISYMQALNNGIVIVKGGHIEDLKMNSSQSITIEGGNIDRLFKENGTVTVKGGNIKNVYGGTIDKYEINNIHLDQTNLSLVKGVIGNLAATVTPNISAPNFPTWESSNTSVATVTGNGATATVTAISAGNATITVKAGNETAICAVTVTEPQSSTVNVSITGTSVTENGGTYSAVYGSDITVTADIAAASTGTKTRAAAKNTVDFYLGSIADENKLNGQSIAVTNNKAALTLTLTGEKWNAGTTPYTILADFGGSDALKENNGTAQLTITPAPIVGMISISGDAVPGSTLTVNYTPRTGESVSYQWNRDAENIPSATEATYVVADGDVGKKITVTVTASDANHIGELTSASVTVNKSEQEKPASGEGYTINFSKETITAKDGYELAESQDAATAQKMLSVTPGTDVYVRKAGTATQEPSGWTLVDVPARPAAPSGVGKVDEAVQGEKGKLTGVTTAMQYRLENATTWTDCDDVQNGAISLAPGTYKVRLKATASEFASAETSTLEIKAGDARTYTLELTAPVFDSVKVGYAQPAAKNLVIKSIGNSDTTITSVTLSGGNAAAFVLNKTDGTKLTAGSTDSATYTIRPAAGLSAGTYTANVTATYDNGGTTSAETVEVKFAVQAAQLAAPQNVVLESTKPGSAAVRWSAVTNARSYSVQLYKDGKAQGDAVPVSSDKTQEFDISAAGRYTVKVKAVGDGTDYTDSGETESTALAFYTVAFDPNGGNAVGSQIIAEGGKAEKPADPARTGYTFAGWYKESNFLNGWDFDTDEVSGAATLYAKWTANQYTVTLNVNGGSIAAGKDVNGYTYGVGATLPTADDVTYTGYTFKGWYEDSSFAGNPVTEISDADTGNKTYWAKWAATSYTVTVTTEGGTGNIASASPMSATLGTPVTLTYQAAEGYHFVKWEVISGGITISKDNTFPMPAGNVEVKAVFTEHQYSGWTANGNDTHIGICSVCGVSKTGTCSYTNWTANGNDTHTGTCSVCGTGKTANCSYADGVCTVCGYVDVAVTTQPQNTTVKEGNPAIFSITAKGKDISYQWQSKVGTNDWADISGAQASGYTTEAASMEMDGTQYRCIVSNGSGDSAASSAVVLTVNKTASEIEPEFIGYFVEHYKKNPVSGEYERADREYRTGKINTTVTVTLKDYPGYTNDPNAAGTVASGKLSEIKGEEDVVILKLYYNPNTYTVKLNAGGGTISSGTITEYTYGIGAILPADVVKEGYIFGGWYSDSNLTGEPVKEIGAADMGNKTYWAKWMRSTTPIIPSDTVRYIAEHYKADKASSTGYTLAETEYLSGTVGETVKAKPNTYTGYTYNPDAAGSVSEGTLKEISSEADILKLKLYYNQTSYTVTVESDGHGTASASSSAAVMGTEIVLTAQADSGYRFKTWEVISGGVTVSNHKFTMPAGDVTVKAVFERKPGGGGSSSGSGSFVSIAGGTVYVPSNGTWHQDETGWWFEKTGGGYPADTWYECVWNKEKLWYHFNAAGYLDSGWFTDKDGNTYFLHDLHDGRFGYMYAGWHLIGGKNYHFNPVSGNGGLPYGALLGD